MESRFPGRVITGLLWVWLVLVQGAAHADETQPPSAARGYDVLRTRPFIPPDFDAEVFDSLWKAWPEPLSKQARNASPEERRRLTFSHYGLVEPPGGEGRGAPLGYVDTPRGWVMSCLACHAGKVAGRVIPGLSNSHFALQTLTEDVRLVKLLLGKKLGHLEKASLTIPLGGSHGTTNAVVFGIVLGTLRDADMRVHLDRSMPELLHHDMDAPPLWNVKKKRSLYVDGFAPKSHRPLMQFMLLPVNDADTVKSWENDFRDVLAWIESLEPPAYPWAIDQQLAGEGRRVFNANCASCHGTYGSGGRYEQKTIPLETIGTDPVRLRAISKEHRQWLRRNWMTRFGADHVDVDPGGYVAPPLDGIWASAPYFHNGSVPTLWHVLHGDERPVVWRRTEDGYDRERVGLEITEFEDLPASLGSQWERRSHFDTRAFGKSAAGHRFPDALTDDEKRAVLKYLKTL